VLGRALSCSQLLEHLHEALGHDVRSLGRVADVASEAVRRVGVAGEQGGVRVGVAAPDEVEQNTVVELGEIAVELVKRFGVEFHETLVTPEMCGCGGGRGLGPWERMFLLRTVVRQSYTMDGRGARQGGPESRGTRRRRCRMKLPQTSPMCGCRGAGVWGQEVLPVSTPNSTSSEAFNHVIVCSGEDLAKSMGGKGITRPKSADRSAR
jgi:hypothetical protein